LHHITLIGLCHDVHRPDKPADHRHQRDDLLSRKCAKVRTVLFLSRRVLLTTVVSDRRDFPDYGGGHPRRSAAITGRTRHG
jgi:hypothetical protein